MTDHLADAPPADDFMPVDQQTITSQLVIDDACRYVRVMGMRACVGVTTLCEYLGQMVSGRATPPIIVDGGTVSMESIADALGAVPMTAPQTEIPDTDSARRRQFGLPDLVILLAHETGRPAQARQAIDLISRYYQRHDCPLPQIIYRRRGCGDAADIACASPTALTRRILHDIARQIYAPDSVEAGLAKRLFASPDDAVLADISPSSHDQTEFRDPEQTDSENTDSQI